MDLNNPLRYFIVIYELKTCIFLYYLWNIIMILNTNLNISDLNFIWKKKV